MDVPGRSVRWMVTLIMPNINRFLPPSTFPTTRGLRFLTGWSSLPYLRFYYEVSQGEEDHGPSGMASTVSRYEYYWAYLGKNEGGIHAIPDDFINKLYDSLPNRWQLFCRPKEPIQDINYLTFSPWWNTRLIFNLLFYLLFEEDKMYWLFDWLLFATRLLSR